MATKLTGRLGVPALVLFLVFGMLAGSEGLDLIYFDNAIVAQLFGVLALIIILFEGGLQTEAPQVWKVKWEAITLATLGVLLTAAIVGAFASYILDVPLLDGFLLGSIVGSTDAAAVFMVLGAKNIKKKLSSILEAESASNDPMAIFLTLSLLQILVNDEANIWVFIGNFFWQMGAGVFLGYLIGKISVKMINKIEFDAAALYPVFSLGLGILTYSLVDWVNGSGFLAVYVAALVIGSSELANRYSILRFNEGVAWMMQILMFVMLGLLVFPSQVIQVVVPGTILSLLLMFVARPIGVLLCMLPFKMSWRGRLFLSWAGLRGAVPIVLATFPLIAEYEYSQLFFNAVFFVVVTSALVQGLTISPLARWLGLEEEEKESSSYSLELVSLKRTRSDIIELSIAEDAPVVGHQLQELDLPTDTLINAIVRDDRIIIPHGETRIEAGDVLFVLVTKKNSRAVKKYLLGSS